MDLTGRGFRGVGRTGAIMSQAEACPGSGQTGAVVTEAPTSGDRRDIGCARRRQNATRDEEVGGGGRVFVLERLLFGGWRSWSWIIGAPSEQG